MELLYSEENRNKNNFGFLRFTLAATVLLTHSYVIYDGNLDNEPLWIASKQQLTLGTLALNFFFVISGFLITQSWNSSLGYTAFLKKRVLRIYPGFIGVCMVCAFLFAPLGLGINHPVSYYMKYISDSSIINLAIKTLLLQRLNGLPETFQTLPISGEVNASLWSISYEFICYQIVPLLALIWVFRKKYLLLVTFTVVMLINIVHSSAYEVYGKDAKLSYNLIPYYPRKYFEELLNFEHLLIFFIAGIVFYIYRKSVLGNYIWQNVKSAAA